ncbi:hypothetical protein [Prochlorococcus sp. MIT 1223]|uniref:hypothetical protein n=1 Tax=Prochlorococcus sp. MIT 1223 TaxID=3096217 RepID=UPI002A765505|nr:hypothetical protein [Prochlorococcus sp. MIT 1223]
MSSYFPLLPSITSNALDKRIDSSTTLLNLPNNLREANQSKVQARSTYIGTYKLQAENWELISIKECKYGAFCDIERNSIKALPDQMVISLVRYENSFPKSARYLPKPDSLRVDSSPVAERVSLNYHFRGATTSFQGEYPCVMSNFNKGSFWSFDALKERFYKHENTESFLVLMNLNRDSEKQSEVDLEIYNPNKKDNILHWKARQNSFTILNLKDINNALGSEKIYEILFIQCKSCTFIPVFLSVDVKNNQLSLEHTHPPSELLWGRERNSIVKLLKKRWL